MLYSWLDVDHHLFLVLFIAALGRKLVPGIGIQDKKKSTSYQLSVMWMVLCVILWLNFVL
jgi:hypothetical protein